MFTPLHGTSKETKDSTQRYETIGHGLTKIRLQTEKLHYLKEWSSTEPSPCRTKPRPN